MIRTIKISLSLLTILLISACSPEKKAAENSAAKEINQSSEETTLPTVPVAKKLPFEMAIHGDIRIDNYYWMRDDKREDSEVLAHLEAENNYLEAQLAHTLPLQKQLFDEIKGRIKKDNNSVPVREGDYFYSSEMSGDNEYPIYVRSDNFAGNNKKVLLDVNKLAIDKDYYDVSGIYVSPNQQILAYGEDTVSRRIYTLKFKDLKTGQLLQDVLEGASGTVVWGNDNQTVYYIKKHPQTLLGYLVYRHKLGTSQSEDELIYEETNPTFYTGIGKSKDQSEIYIYHSATETKGVSVVDANDPKAKAIAFTPLTMGHEYSIAKLGNDYYILTNQDAKNFKIMKVNRTNKADKTRWQDVISHDPAVQIQDFELFSDQMVIKQRENGLSSVIVKQLSTGQTQTLKFKDSAYSVYFYGNHELNNNKLRLYYTSMTTPGTDYDIDLMSKKCTLLKQDPVLGDFNSDNYASERISVEARDGTEVPVTLVYRKDRFKKDGINPIYQYGYGSYGSTVEPGFSSYRLSLLDRGFVYAIAHIRGSQMLGRPWYENGKKLNKINTFNDFVDVTKGLTAKGYGAKDKVFAVGASAGGLLMGAVINQAPELYRGVAVHVPFVDVVTTMLDESIPLTTNEYDEWGNPNNKEYYDYMLSYSPYDQVKRQTYPNLLVTTGLHDSQVQYFEPMKWVAKLREYKTGDNLLVFKTDMEAGHGGASGRFKRIHDTALEYAFFIDLLEKK